MKIGVFGSALNPMTLGHVDGINQALEVCDKVIVVPSYAHAFGKRMKPFDVRCELASMTIDHEFGGESVELSRIEESISHDLGDRPVYTYDLLSELTKQYPDDDFVFLCGTDNVEILEKFYKYEEIVASWGFQELTERTPIRSTLVRNCVAQKQSIKGLVSPVVEERIIKEYNQ